MKIGRFLDFAADNVGNLLFAFFAAAAIGGLLLALVAALLSI